MNSLDFRQLQERILRGPRKETANNWLAVIASWIIAFYGIGWGFIALVSTGPGAALLVFLKAMAIAAALLLIGCRVTAFLARRRR